MNSDFVYTGIMPPTIQEVKIYFSQKGMPDLEADHFFLFYEKKEWKSKNGQPFKGWKHLAWNWARAFMATHKWVFNKNIH